MEDDDSDAEMADYGTDFSDDVDPNSDASSLPGHSRIGNRVPRFPGFGGDFPIPVPGRVGNRKFPPRFPAKSGIGGTGIGDFQVCV